MSRSTEAKAALTLIFFQITENMFDDAGGYLCIVQIMSAFVGACKKQVFVLELTTSFQQ